MLLTIYSILPLFPLYTSYVIGWRTVETCKFIMGLFLIWTVGQSGKKKNEGFNDFSVYFIFKFFLCLVINLRLRITVVYLVRPTRLSHGVKNACDYTCDQMGCVFSVVFGLTDCYGPCVEEQRLRRRVHPIGTTVLPFLCVTGRSTPVFLTTRALESDLVCVPTCFSSRVSTGYIRTLTRMHQYQLLHFVTARFCVLEWTT